MRERGGDRCWPEVCRARTSLPGTEVDRQAETSISRVLDRFYLVHPDIDIEARFDAGVHLCGAGA